jgi:hypothetical protein
MLPMGFASRPSAPALENHRNKAHVTAETENTQDGVPAGTTEDPATSHKRGSYNYDQEHSQYPFEWKDIANFEAWHQEEELADTIKIISSTSHRGLNVLWTKHCIFMCGHQLSRGKNKYMKKHPNWKQKLPSKKTGCCFHLVIKHYPYTTAILGNYRGITITKQDYQISFTLGCHTKCRRKLSLCCDKRLIQGRLYVGLLSGSLLAIASLVVLRLIAYSPITRLQVQLVF